MRSARTRTSILIGELRDAETAQTALQAAESGHLVLSTLHTIDAAETVARMVEFFPPEKQQVIRAILAGVLRGVVSQRLLPRDRRRTGRRGRGDGHERAHRRPDPRGQAPTRSPTRSPRASSSSMQTFTQALIEHVLSGEVDREVAANAATNRHDFLVALEQAEKRQRADQAPPRTAPNAGPAVAEHDAERASSSRRSRRGSFGLRVVPAG